jgi:hypothetical protein
MGDKPVDTLPEKGIDSKKLKVSDFRYFLSNFTRKFSAKLIQERKREWEQELFQFQQAAEWNLWI